MKLEGLKLMTLAELKMALVEFTEAGELDGYYLVTKEAGETFVQDSGFDDFEKIGFLRSMEALEVRKMLGRADSVSVYAGQRGN